jgi:hypothetical protein
VTRRIETCDVSDGSSAAPPGLGTTTKAMYLTRLGQNDTSDVITVFLILC